jgi:hypothetical protein
MKSHDKFYVNSKIGHQDFATYFQKNPSLFKLKKCFPTRLNGGDDFSHHPTMGIPFGCYVMVDITFGHSRTMMMTSVFIQQ